TICPFRPRITGPLRCLATQYTSSPSPIPRHSAWRRTASSLILTMTYRLPGAAANKFIVDLRRHNYWYVLFTRGKEYAGTSATKNGQNKRQTRPGLSPVLSCHH